MPYYHNLADIARRTGFPVVEESGWKSRGHGSMSTVRSVICHHDAARHSPGTFNTVIRDGHSSLAGPLSHFALRRDGTIHVVAAGLCWHAGATINASLYGNPHAIGIEAGNDGLGEPWPRRQLDAYQALCAELCKSFGLPPSRVQGHKEIAYPTGRKVDPRGINMNSFRGAVARRMTGGGGAAPAGGGDDMPSADEVAKAVWKHMIYNNQLKRKEWAETVLGANQDRVIRQQIAPMRRQLNALTDLVAKQSNVSADEIATALRAGLAADLVPVLQDVLGEAQADEIADRVLDKLGTRLTGEE